ncbi:MAG TPA: hypothetical protein VEJ23_00740 [Solirubrobacteraceae bacterium]|nr:hypothetical protein [Solirubrobacteraceae bacterium]
MHVRAGTVEARIPVSLRSAVDAKVRLAGDARVAQRLAYAEAGHQVITVPTGGPADLGWVFLLAELAVAVAGWGLQINPFDQPNVQQAKDATNRVLDGYRADGTLPGVADADEQALRSLLVDARPPSYVALMGYVQPTPSFDAAIAELRTTLRAATKATRRSATARASCTPPGSSTRAGPRRGAFCSCCTTARRTSTYRASRTRSPRSRTLRRSATCRRCATSACRRSGSDSPETTRLRRCTS